MNRLQREQAFHNTAFQEPTRSQVASYYRLVEASHQAFLAEWQSEVNGRRMLEYGCGVSLHAWTALQQGAALAVGIDVSDVAVRQVQARTGGRVGVAVMDAEHLGCVGGQFDVVCGSSILHHLDLDRAYAEIARLLVPSGVAVFLEPLGHNILINFFRRWTPQLRTVDEHPLVLKDLDLARRYFRSVHIRYFHLLSLASLPLRQSAWFPAVRGWLDRADHWLFQRLPFVQRYAWVAVLTLRDPIVAAVEGVS